MIGEQMESCLAQISLMASFSPLDAGLRGSAFSTLQARLNARQWVAQAHYVALEAVRSANDANQSKLGQLEPSESDGSVDTDLCQQRINDQIRSIDNLKVQRDCDVRALKGTKAEFYVPVVIRTYELSMAACRAIAERYANIKDKAETYIQASGTYDAACSIASSLLAQSTESVAACVSGGAYPKNLPWTQDLDRQFLRARVNHRVAQAKPYMTDEELEAYRNALSDDSLITEGDIYSGGQLDEALWAGMCKLPSELVGDLEVEAAARAYSFMWATKDFSAAERFLELSYVAVGESEEGVFTPGLNPDTGLVEPIFTVYRYDRSPLLDRVAEKAVASLSDMELEDVRFSGALAGANLLSQVVKRDSTAWGTSSDGLDMALVSMEKNGVIVSALSMNPSLVEAGYALPNPSNTQARAAYSIDFCVTGNLEEARLVLGEIDNGAQVKDFDFMGSLARYGIEEGADFLLNEIPLVGPILSKLAGAGSAVFGDWEGSSEKREAAERDNEDDRVTARSDANLLESFAFGLNLYGEGLEGFSYDLDYLRPEPSLYAPKGAGEVVDALADSYNHETGGNYSSKQFESELEKNLYGSLAGEGDEGRGTREFLAWCDEPAELVYREDSTDTAHQPGEEVPGSTSNFDYAVDRNNQYSNYQYKWEHERQQGGAS